jgi:large subunit ribosomal protein L3
MAGKGILGRKVGMTQVFDENGRAVPITVVEAGPCRIAQVKTPERDGYSAVQLAYGPGRRTTKPMAGHFAKAGIDPARHLVELRVDDTSDFELGAEIRSDVFDAGELVDVIGVTKGKGFAGVMKRHNFKGLSASHGTERKHRSPGSVNAGTTPGRVFKGKKLPGHLGHERVTVLSLQIVEADPERDLLLIRGAVPGPNGGLVLVRNAVKATAEKKS